MPSEADADENRKAAAVEAYARDHEGLTAENERDALDHVLAPKPPRLYDVKVEYDMDDATVPLTFVIRGYSGRKIDGIEQGNRDAATGKFDQITADCQLVAAATIQLVGHTGRTTKLTSEEFLTVKRQKIDAGAIVEGEWVETKLASPADALEARFESQMGLITGVAREIRRVSGYDAARVGSAQRRLVEASGNF